MPVKFEIKAKTGEGKDGKGFYTRIGVVLQGDKGYSIKLNVLPLNWDGFAILQEPEAPSQRPQNSRQGRGNYAPPAQDDDFDQDVPF